MGQVSLFLGIEFHWTHHSDGHVTVHLTQQSFAETLIESIGFDSLGTSTFLTSYWSASLVGSLNWLAHTMRPDLATIVSLLAQHQSNPSPRHMEAAHYATKC
jgi:hypothetical protein